MAGGNSAKGNPATHRMSNPKRKARREACWARGQKRKQERQKATEAAAKRNAELHYTETLTPWELAKLKRYAKRDAKRQVWLRRQSAAERAA